MRCLKLTLLALTVCCGLACAHCSKESPNQADEAGVDASLPDDASSPADAGSDAADVRDAGATLDAGPGDAGPGDASPARDAASAADARGEEAGAANDGGTEAATGAPAHTFVYVGGYSDTDPLRVYEIDRASLALTRIAHDAGVGPQPSYITPRADGRTLYVVNETDSNPGITVLRVDPATGVPTRMDHEDAVSSPYVFSSASPDGKYLLATSYNGGNIGVYPIKPDGSLDPRVDMRSFGANAQSHSVRVHASGAVFVPNKGLDSVAQLKLDAAGKLSPATPDAFPAQAARNMFDGPRHIAFSRDSKLAFVILELGDALISLAIENNGTLRELDRKPRLPANSPSDTGAHVLAHPGANFVYGSNRGSNTLVAFAYDEQGRLTLLGHVDSRGRTPRDFDIDPRGEFLVVANQEGNNGGTLAVFAIGADGRLVPKGEALMGLSSPAAVAIVAF
jgi:6-phosphogluconolactonase